MFNIGFKLSYDVLKKFTLKNTRFLYDNQAADLGIESDLNIEWDTQQVNYALGSNGRSFLIGYGVDPPVRPHHTAR